MGSNAEKLTSVFKSVYYFSGWFLKIKISFIKMNVMETITIPRMIDMEAIDTLTVVQRLAIIEAIQNSMGKEYDIWLQSQGEDEDEGKDDLTLAQEALIEYDANPESAIPWDEFYKAELESLKAKQLC